MKNSLLAAWVLIVLLFLPSCKTQRPVRSDDPYMYKRGPWNFSKGGIFDDVPQFTIQMLESMLDYGPQPIDPPSLYAPEETYAPYQTEVPVGVYEEGRQGPAYGTQEPPGEQGAPQSYAP